MSIVREAEPLLRADGGGTVVNITSRVVKEVASTNVLSSSVRMAVVGFEKTLSKELGPEIRSNAVLLGAHETHRLERGFEWKAERGDFETAANAAEIRRQEIPMKQFGDPAEFGNLITFLSSPRASFVNGLAIVVNGGSGKSTL